MNRKFVLMLAGIGNHWKKLRALLANKRHDLGMLFFAPFSTVRGVTLT